MERLHSRPCQAGNPALSIVGEAARRSSGSPTSQPLTIDELCTDPKRRSDGGAGTRAGNRGRHASEKRSRYVLSPTTWSWRHSNQCARQSPAQRERERRTISRATRQVFVHWARTVQLPAKTKEVSSHKFNSNPIQFKTSISGHRLTHRQGRGSHKRCLTSVSHIGASPLSFD